MRTKLTVVSASEPKTFGQGGQKLHFKASGDDGNVTGYVCYKASLFEHIKAEAVLEVEVEDKEVNYQGEKYTEHRIRDIFLNGQPVGGGRSFGRGNADAQAAAKIVADLLIEKTIGYESSLAKALFKWCEGKLNG